MFIYNNKINIGDTFCAFYAMSSTSLLYFLEHRKSLLIVPTRIYQCSLPASLFVLDGNEIR